MHAVARLALSQYLPNIQTSWVKMGEIGAEVCLKSGANDLGGTLMNETITRSAGATHGQEKTPRTMESIIRRAGRVPLQRTTLYKNPPEEQRINSYNPKQLLRIINSQVERKPPSVKIDSAYPQKTDSFGVYAQTAAINSMF